MNIINDPNGFQSEADIDKLMRQQSQIEQELKENYDQQLLALKPSLVIISLTNQSRSATKNENKETRPILIGRDQTLVNTINERIQQQTAKQTGESKF